MQRCPPIATGDPAPGGVAAASVYSMAVDHYEILGIAPTADQRTVRAAYLARMRAVHPDLAPNDPQAQRTARQLNAAYDVLSDPERRRRYDTLRSSRRVLDSWHTPVATRATAEELRRLAATRSAYSSHGVDFRQDFRRVCLRFGVGVLAVGVVVLFTIVA